MGLGLENYQRYKPGGISRAALRRRRYLEAARRAEEEIKRFKIGEIGEPSGYFWPPKIENEEVVIYLADRRKKKERKQEYESATPQDIANRMREQDERVIVMERGVGGNPLHLRPEWIRYYVKRWDTIQALKVEPGRLSTAESSLPVGKVS